MGEESLATLNFNWISVLCVNASLVLSPGRGNVGDDGFSRERGARGAAEGHRSSLIISGEKDAPLEHKCGACGWFFLSSLPGFTFVCAFQREGKILHGCGKHLGKK